MRIEDALDLGLVSPLDDTHAASLAALDEIEEHFLDLQMSVAAWEPRPMPSDWNPHEQR